MLLPTARLQRNLAHWTLLLLFAAGPAMAQDGKVLLANIFDGLREQDYPRVVTNFLPIMLESREPQSKVGRNCISALKASNTAGAQEACSASAAASPDDPQAPLSLGLAKLLGRDANEASRQFFKAAKIKPPFEPALFMALFGQPHGMTALDQVVISEADRAAVDQALFDFKKGDFASAAKGFQRAYDGGATTGTVPLMLFVAQKRAGQAPTVALADGPTDDAGYHMLVQALRGDKAPKEALREYRVNWGEYDADYPKNRFFLGEAALFQGDKEEAIRFFRKAVAAKKLDQIESELAAAELVRLEAE